MEELTKEEKQLCIDKWQWLYNHPSKKDLPKRLQEKSEKYFNDCVLCDKVNLQMREVEFACKECPIYGKEGCSCFDGYSSFRNWDDTEDIKTRKKYAGKLLEIMKEL